MGGINFLTFNFYFFSGDFEVYLIDIFFCALLGLVVMEICAFFFFEFWFATFSSKKVKNRGRKGARRKIK